MINPKGEKFNIGDTLFMRCPLTILWVVKEPKLNASFIVIYFHPSASAATPMYLFYLDSKNTPKLSAKIMQHYELDVRDNNGIARCGIVDGGKDGKELSKVLFMDYDNNGVPELKEDLISQTGGKINYYCWCKMEQAFKPLWIETYSQDSNSDSGFKLISKERTQTNCQ